MVDVRQNGSLQLAEPDGTSVVILTTCFARSALLKNAPDGRSNEVNVILIRHVFE